MTPRKPFSLPIAASMATQLRPNFLTSWSTTRPASARSRSIRLTTTTRGSPSSSASFQAFSVWTSTPATASTTIRAASAALRPQIISETKIPYPGVSIRLTFRFFHSRAATARPTEIFRSTSSASKSVGACPSSTRPKRVVAPASWRRAETRVVLPTPLWPTTATLWMADAG